MRLIIIYQIFNSRKPKAQNWYDLAIGSSLAHISLTINTQKSEVKSQIWIDDSKLLFDYLFDLKDEIEDSIGFELIWERLDGKKASYIYVVKNINIRDENNWGKSIDWQLDMASKLYGAFAGRIKQFNS